MPVQDGLVEADIVINGIELSFAEAMAVRVAVGTMRLTLTDPAYRRGLGEQLTKNYDVHLRRVEVAMLRNQRNV